MKKREQLPMAKGFTCECGRYEEFGGYVAAHWNEELIFTCPKCGKRHSIYKGVAGPEGEDSEDD